MRFSTVSFTVKSSGVIQSNKPRKQTGRPDASPSSRCSLDVGCMRVGVDWSLEKGVGLGLWVQWDMGVVVHWEVGVDWEVGVG